MLAARPQDRDLRCRGLPGLDTTSWSHLAFIPRCTPGGTNWGHGATRWSQDIPASWSSPDSNLGWNKLGSTVAVRWSRTWVDTYVVVKSNHVVFISQLVSVGGVAKHVGLEREGQSQGS